MANAPGIRAPQRTAQLRAAAQHLHNLGPRSTFEFLCDSRPALTCTKALSNTPGLILQSVNTWAHLKCGSKTRCNHELYCN